MENSNVNNVSFIELKKNAVFYSDPQSIGTEEYHKLTMNGRVLFTDGVKTLAEKMDAYWLMDIISSYYGAIHRSDGNFFGMFLFLNENGGATFYITDGNDNVLIKQNIQYTDIKMNVKLFIQRLDEWKFVVMLSTEY